MSLYSSLSCPRMTGVGATEVLNAINSEGSSVSDLRYHVF